MSCNIDNQLVERLLRGELQLTEAKAHRPELKILAVDLPTGLDADTGNVDPACVTADVTMTMATGSAECAWLLQGQRSPSVYLWRH